LSAYDERLAVVDTGDTLVLSVPIPPSTETGGTPVDLQPILDRLGDLEQDVAGIKQVDVTQTQAIADLVSRVDAAEQIALVQAQQIADITARLDALEAATP
jgi:hypothetical protein